MRSTNLHFTYLLTQCPAETEINKTHSRRVWYCPHLVTFFSLGTVLTLPRNAFSMVTHFSPTSSSDNVSMNSDSRPDIHPAHNDIHNKRHSFKTKWVRNATHNGAAKGTSSLSHHSSVIIEDTTDAGLLGRQTEANNMVQWQPQYSLPGVQLPSHNTLCQVLSYLPIILSARPSVTFP